MPLLNPLYGSIDSASLSVPVSDSGGVISVLFTVCTVISMASILAMCACCRKNPKNREEEDGAYGVIPTTVTTASSGDNAHSTGGVAFRSLTKIARLQDRHSHSQQHSKDKPKSTKSTRTSAPDRALPQLPADLYSAIDKTRRSNLDDIEYADEASNPMYECIDVDNDSMIDPLYSKVGPTARHGERKYDYPVFAGKHENRPANGRLPMPSTSDRNVNPASEDPFYQSASQIYGPASEDPYSSINSDTRADAGDGDSCDPGYARVKTTEDPKKLEQLEITERELDKLYSNIRRSTRNQVDDSLNTPQAHVPIDALSNIPVAPTTSSQIDTQSISSREPSYRYLTTRESAEVVRERLREQGRLAPPIREHYYSTIGNGNEYETVDGASSAYGVVPSRPVDILTVSTGHTSDGTPNESSDFVPPPPTSPIPTRLASAALSPNQPSTSRADNLTSTYAVVSKPKQKTTTFEVVPMRPAAELPSIHSPFRPANGPRMSTSMNETLLGKRTVEEKEVIVEKRNSYIATSSQQAPFNQTQNIMNRSFDGILASANRANSLHQNGASSSSNPGSEQRVYPVEIKRQSHSNLWPTGNENVGVKFVIIRLSDMANDMISSTTSSRDLSNERKKNGTRHWKEETEAEKIERLGTIYTANDYVSTIDMGTERPWPFGAPSQSGIKTSRGRNRRSGEMTELGQPGEDLEERARDAQFYRTNDNNNAKKTSQQRSTISSILAWDLSEDEMYRTPRQVKGRPRMIQGSNECVGTCFCHGPSPRAVVIGANKQQMSQIRFGQPLDD
ncbi:hypothetical protein WR25_19994 [Diploscapter pachys]|uniref:Uncharacterized protein n=1 Tax=Diploscapter pachys TaxID=2018661 RepID=A0A2A2LE68_9BILA|nr:hypothetical protein WR25_19994 [Diploscapter pachys]